MKLKKLDVLILGLNYDQLNYIKIIKQRGFNIFGVDKNPHAPGVIYCEHYLNCSYTNTLKIIKFLKNKKFSKSGKLFTASSQISFLSLAKISNVMSLNFIDPKVVDKCIDKSKMNRLLLKRKIPIPITRYLTHQRIYVDKKKEYILKSDYGKSPKYCYNIKSAKLPKFPKKDDFFKKYFLLQEKILGEHYRINIVKNNFFIFKKYNDSLSRFVLKIKYFDLEVKTELRDFISWLKLQKFLIKFDIIVNKKSWYLIDIGFDPPKRLEHSVLHTKKNFYKMYVENWIFKKNTFKDFDYQKLLNYKIKFLKNGKVKFSKYENN